VSNDQQQFQMAAKEFFFDVFVFISNSQEKTRTKVEISERHTTQVVFVKHD